MSTESTRWSEDKAPRSLSDLKSRFTESPGRYRPVPWLGYSGSLTEEEVLASIEEMHRQSIYSFFIFPVYGMEIEYLSPEWFSLVRKSVRRAASLGMEVWIYDDYNWPSGTCGGKLILEHPEYSIRRIEAFISDYIPPGEELRFPGQDPFIKTVAVTESGRSLPATLSKDEESGYSWKNDTAEPARITHLYIQEPAPLKYNLCLFKGSLWQKEYDLGTHYLEFLNPDAVEEFITMTYRRYRSELKDLWSSIAGFMTDEPSLRESIHYYPPFLKTFEKTYGYNLEDRLEHLFLPGSENAFQVRADYWRLAGKIFAENLGRINRWCRKHGVDFTGHFLGEESPGAEVWHQGSAAVRKEMSIPGMDVLYDTPCDPTPSNTYSTFVHHYDNLALTGKLVSAASETAGSRRAFAEAFGGFPYWGGPADLTAQTHWTTAQGINFINDNSLSVSWKSFRKRTLWGKHFTMPWWECYSNFVKTAGRCCLLESVGRPIRPIGLVYPELTAQALTFRNWHRGSSGVTGTLLQSNKLVQETASALSLNHRDWGILWENGLSESSGDRENCRILIIPGAYCLSRKILEDLMVQQRKGICLIFVGSAPEYFIDGDNDLCRDILDRLMQCPNVYRINPREADRYIIERAIEPIIDGQLDRSFSISGPGKHLITASARMWEDTGIIHLVNMSPRTTRVSCFVTTKDPVSLWHPDDGKTYSVSGVDLEQGQKFSLEFAPWEGYFLVSSREAVVTDHPLPPRDAAQGLEGFTLRHTAFPEPLPDFLSLDNKWDITPESVNTLAPDMYFHEMTAESGPPSESAGWLRADDEKLPFPLNPSESEYYWHRCDFFAEYLPDDIAAVVDSDLYEAAFINGNPLPDPSPVTLWDRGNLSFRLGGYIKPGDNSLTFKVKTDPHYDPKVVLKSFEPFRLEPVIVSGSFGVAIKDKGKVIGPKPDRLFTGDWGLQGFYNYSGVIVYRHTFTALPQGSQVWLDLGSVGVCAHLKVNGREAGRRCWPPYMFRIDPYLEEGKNTLLIRVMNTFGNLFEKGVWGFDHKTGMAPSGILGPVKLIGLP